MQQFGHRFREEFEIDPNSTVVNHCSFGYFPKTLVKAKFDYMLKIYQTPEKFFFNEISQLLVQSRKDAADFLDSPWEQTFFTTNVTSGITAILNYFNFKKDDKILYSSLNYPMVQNNLIHLNKKVGTQITQIQFQYDDLNDEKILQIYEEYLKEGYNIVFLDLIVYNPAYLMPIKQIVQLCRKYNCISVVDAAHGVGVLELSIRDLDPDFFMTNFNKWGYVPGTCTLFYINEKFILDFHPHLIGSNYGLGLDKEYEFEGNQDRTSYLCVSKAIEFMKQHGLKEIIEYNNNIAYDGAKKMAEIWNTELLLKNKQDNKLPMVSARLPIDDPQLGLKLTKKCLQDYNVWINFRNYKGQNWVRVSGQIYNELQDYEYAANCLLKVIQENP